MTTCIKFDLWLKNFPPRHDVVLQAGADERPGVLHISWAGNKYLTRPLYHQFFHSFLKLLKRILVQKLPKSAWFPPGPDSSAALPSAECAPSNPLLVLRQQQLAPAGDPSSQLPCYTISLSLFSILVISLSKVSYSPRVHSVAHMLLVTEAQGGDAGQYRCTARNEVPDLYFWLFFIIAVFESTWQESFWGDIRDNWQKYKISRSRWASCLWLFIFKWSRLLSLVSCSTSVLSIRTKSLSSSTISYDWAIQRVYWKPFDQKQ